MQFRIGGLVFDGGRAVNTPFTIAPGMSGWLGADMRRESIDRPAAHGAFGTPGFLAGREISWSGLILTDNEYAQVHEIRKLSSLLADGGTDRLTGEDTDTLWCDVQRVDLPTPQVLVPGRIASYRVSWFAPNPRLYGEVKDYAAGVEAINRGNFKATPRLMVGAGTGGYTVTGPNGRVVTVGTAPAAAHYIDLASGGLFTTAGVRQPNAITVYQPWAIPVGLPGVTASISGARTLSQRVTDTFV